jgi:hypothetical protein
MELKNKISTLILFAIAITLTISPQIFGVENMCGPSDFTIIGTRYNFNNYQLAFDTGCIIIDWEPIIDTLKASLSLSVNLGDKKLMSFDNCDVIVFNFCKDEVDTSKFCPIFDINKDGKDEIMIDEYTGGAHCCHYIGIYTLDTSATCIFYVDAEHVDITPHDIDGDSICELESMDCLFSYWQACYAESPFPTLIWKWDNGAYRLANFQYADYLLKGYTDEVLSESIAWLKSEADSLKIIVKSYKFNPHNDPDDKTIYYPNPGLWTVMLSYIYAGKSNVADSIFNIVWPAEIEGKEEFYKDFRQTLESGPHWEELLNSAN